MPDQLQLRGGTTTEHNSFTGALREVTVDTTKKTLVVHDGSQAGGTPLMKESGTVDPTSITIGTGGTQRLAISNSEVVFNDTGADVDFRIEGDGEANLFKVDASSDRIGIGLASPVTTLDVNGDVTITDKIIHAGDTDTAIRFHGANSFSVETGGIQRLSVSDSGTTISTTTDASLFINSTASGGPHMRFQTSGTTKSFIGQAQGISGTLGGADDLGIRSASAFAVATNNNSTVRLKVDTSGRLLVGATSSTATGVGNSKLQISGTGADTAGMALIRTTNDSGGAYLQFVKNRGAAIQDNDNCGAIAWLGHDGTDNNNYLAQISVKADADAGSNAMSGRIEFGTSDNSTVFAERMSIDSKGGVLIGRNDDSYTSTARARLSIDCHEKNAVAALGDASKYGLVFLNSPTSDQGNGIGFFNDSGSTCGGAILHQDKGGGNIGDLVFYTSQTSDTPLERLRINKDGKTLIGTSTAESDCRMVVDGSIAQTASHTGTGAIIKQYVVSKAYTMSTSTTSVLKLDNFGTSGFEITAFRNDFSSPHGAEIKKLYVAVQGSGSNMTSVSIVVESKLTKGSIHNVTYTANDNGDFVTIDATGDDNGGEAQVIYFYIIATNGGGTVSIP